ncbi:hypothetical protein EYC84_011419 [Monilinia fructicola]|uniref:Uncharacterized protein n=1 Tax=Monilinia fructicola TaxID=38448 RepID=A0A5M9J563_MONFR|nr:hypothetical protein EYC84_011419 [Monilinia fructicola]
MSSQGTYFPSERENAEGVGKEKGAGPEERSKGNVIFCFIHPSQHTAHCTLHTAHCTLNTTSTSTSTSALPVQIIHGEITTGPLPQVLCTKRTIIHLPNFACEKCFTAHAPRFTCHALLSAFRFPPADQARSFTFFYPARLPMPPVPKEPGLTSILHKKNSICIFVCSAVGRYKIGKKQQQQQGAYHGTRLQRRRERDGWNEVCLELYFIVFH